MAADNKLQYPDRLEQPYNADQCYRHRNGRANELCQQITIKLHVSPLWMSSHHYHMEINKSKR